MSFTVCQVELTEVDGDDAESRTTSRARKLKEGAQGMVADWGINLKGEQSRAKGRELQSGVRQIYHV